MRGQNLRQCRRRARSNTRAAGMNHGNVAGDADAYEPSYRAHRSIGVIAQQRLRRDPRLRRAALPGDRNVRTSRTRTSPLTRPIARNWALLSLAIAEGTSSSSSGSRCVREAPACSSSAQTSIASPYAIAQRRPFGLKLAATMDAVDGVVERPSRNVECAHEPSASPRHCAISPLSAIETM